MRTVIAFFSINPLGKGIYDATILSYGIPIPRQSMEVSFLSHRWHLKVRGHGREYREVGPEGDSTLTE